MTISVPRPLALAVSAALAATCIGVSGAALAVDQTVEFGAPTVTSEQGQRLKVVVPVRSAPDDRATAASFMVRETEVPQGYPAVATGGFTVMRPAKADYVVLQSGEIVNSPEVSLIVSVATNVTAIVSESVRLVRHTRRMARTSISPPATMNSTAAIDATGRNVASGRTSSRIASRKNAENTQASGVRAPAS